MDFKSHITLKLKNIGIEEVELEVPKDSALGDFAFPCFSLSKQFRKSPARISKEISEQIKSDDFIEKIVSTGPYVNFFIFKKNVSKQLFSEIFALKENYGRINSTEKTYVIEYPAPNTNKPLHIGHVRNMILGSTLISTLTFAGNKVHPVNLINDRGIHICKSMLAYKLFGENKEPDKKSDHFVGDYYVLFANKAAEDENYNLMATDMLVKWEDGDLETIALWKKMNNWAISGMNQTFARFKISHEKVYFESDIYLEGKNIVNSALDKGLFKKDPDGKIIAELSKYNLPDKVLLRADGTSIYITQDIALAIHKLNDFGKSNLIYVVGSEQNLHFEQLFSILEILNIGNRENFMHYSYGMVYLPEGKMKSREGKVVDADNLLDDLHAKVLLQIKSRYPDLDSYTANKRSESIAQSALRFFMIKMDPKKDFVFNIEESISFDGETGPYCQYTYARINSILKKAGDFKLDFDPELLSEDLEKDLIMKLFNFKEIVKKASDSFNPSLIAKYTYDLCQTFNEYYHIHRVVIEDENLMNARLNLCFALKQILYNSLLLLLIDPLDEM